MSLYVWQSWIEVENATKIFFDLLCFRDAAVLDIGFLLLVGLDSCLVAITQWAIEPC